VRDQLRRTPNAKNKKEPTSSRKMQPSLGAELPDGLAGYPSSRIRVTGK
jgi:hypothetical protein